MVRVLVYVAIVFLLAAGVAWLADRPGELLVTWQGYEIRASLMVAAIAAAVAIGLLALFGAILRAILNAPMLLGRFIGARRRERGYRALSAGMIAVGAGDLRAARRAAQESRSLLGEEPLTLLLSAQAAQLGRDGTAAREAFETLAARPDTRVLGLHGLFVEARRQGEHVAARHFAEEAAHLAPRIGWAGTALFEYQSRAGDWQGALRTLSANADAKLVDRDRARRLRAVLQTARAIDLESGEPDEARLLAQEAHRLAPDLAPAAVVAGRLLARKGEIRRAIRVLETAWKAAPHPDIAAAYADVRPGDSARDRLKRMKRLADIRANHPEGAIALAHAAVDARDWGAARGALEGLVRSGPSERVCLLMAEIEEKEHGDQGRVRVWLMRAIGAPRDPTWIADGQVFDRWAPVSPISGRVDAFEWKAAPEHLPPREAIEIAASEATPAEPAPAEPMLMAPEPARPSPSIDEPEPQSAGPVEVASASSPALQSPSPPSRAPRLAEPAAPRLAEPVAIPHAPDDPGPGEGEGPSSGRFGAF